MINIKISKNEWEWDSRSFNVKIITNFGSYRYTHGNLKFIFFISYELRDKNLTIILSKQRKRTSHCKHHLDLQTRATYMRLHHHKQKHFEIYRWSCKWKPKHKCENHHRRCSNLNSFIKSIARFPTNNWQKLGLNILFMTGLS